MIPLLRSLLVCLCVLSASQAVAEPFELKDGDKVVWLGSTLIEREQRYGYWETDLTARWPDRKITFRNLAWSGDNVFGEARLAFDINTPALGLKRMVDLTLAEKPTVIFICYGTNESFEGEAGLEKFQKGYEKLLDALAPAKARIVLMTPNRFENVGANNSKSKERNRDLALYCNVIKEISSRKQFHFIDLFGTIVEGYREADEPITFNGMHLDGLGYKVAEFYLRTELEGKNDRIETGGADLVIFKEDGSVDARSVKAVAVKRPHPAFELTAKQIPASHWNHKRYVLRVRGLPEGMHTLLIDGKVTRYVKTAEEWTKQVGIDSIAETDQVEQLRQAIIEKNQLYFYRWRPQNETYLLGFRKHEQGRNAKEIAEFDPLIAKMEEEINKLKKPKTHRYEIVPTEKK